MFRKQLSKPTAKKRKRNRTSLFDKLLFPFSTTRRRGFFLRYFDLSLNPNQGRCLVIVGLSLNLPLSRDRLSPGVGGTYIVPTRKLGIKM